MKSKIILFTALIMIAGSASAFPADLEVVERTASVDDPAVFNLTVENDYTNDDRFRISSIQSPPIVSNWFDYEYSKNIDSGETEVFQIEITPEENSIQQNYAFTVNIRSFRNEELKKIESFFTVVNEYDLKITSFQVSEQEIDPGETVKVSATVQNTASERLDNFSVEVEGFESTVERKGAALGSGDSIRYNFELDVPEMQKPGEEQVSIMVKNNGEEAQSASQTVDVREDRNIQKNTSEDDRLLTKTGTITLQNSGNVEDEETVEWTLPVYLDPLAGFEPLPDEKDTMGADQNYMWNLELEPGESKSVSYTVSYIPALGFIALLFIGVLGFKKLQTDLKVSKTASYRNGEAKIRIEIENNSSTALDEIKVTDFIPDIAEVSQDFDMAKPVVTKTSSGTRLEWDIGSLEPGEQRVLVYKINPLVEVEGGVNLDSAEIMRGSEKIKETSEVNVEFQTE